MNTSWIYLTNSPVPIFTPNSKFEYTATQTTLLLSSLISCWELKYPKHILNFHPYSVGHPCNKGQHHLPICSGHISWIIFHSDPHPIQQKTLLTYFKYIPNPTTSHILHRWHLSACHVNTSHRPVTSSCLCPCCSSPLFSPMGRIPHTEARAILWKHWPIMSLLLSTLQWLPLTQ